MRLNGILLSALVLLAAAGAASAGWTTVFEDNFNSYSPRPDFSWTGGGVWNTGGTWDALHTNNNNGLVDLIGDGTGTDYYPVGNGGYLDMNNSAPGYVQKTFSLVAGQYQVTFEAAGSWIYAHQNWGPTDPEVVNMVTTGSVSGALANASITRNYTDLFTAVATGFTITGSEDVTIKVSSGTLLPQFPGVGALVDNFKLEVFEQPTPPPPPQPTVPAPGALVLAGLGCTLVGWMKRRVMA